MSAAIWSTTTRCRARSSAAPRRQRAELRVEALGCAGAQSLGQLGQDHPLLGAHPLLLGTLHHIQVGDSLEHGALQPRARGERPVRRRTG